MSALEGELYKWNYNYDDSGICFSVFQFLRLSQPLDLLALFVWQSSVSELYTCDGKNLRNNTWMVFELIKYLRSNYNVQQQSAFNIFVNKLHNSSNRILWVVFCEVCLNFSFRLKGKTKRDCKTLIPNCNFSSAAGSQTINNRVRCVGQDLSGNNIRDLDSQELPTYSVFVGDGEFNDVTNNISVENNHR